MRVLFTFVVAIGGLFLAWPVQAAGLTPDQIARLPAPAGHPIDFRKEVEPILATACVKCHGRGQAKGDFSLEDRAALLKGGTSGPAIVPGKSAESYLIELVSGLNPDEVMPVKGSRLKADQVGVLRAWIDQGAPWDEAVRFAKPIPNNLKPRRPELSADSARSAHPVDQWLAPYFAAQGVRPGRPVADRVFARRVYLDTIGLLPSPEELAEFERDPRPDKRVLLVRRLLGDSRRYAEHWLTFWNDLLRNDYKGTGYIDGGREQITRWLYAALAKNMPFDQFVRELVNPTPESAGFAKGIVWRGVVNASQTPQMQAAQNISQVFMGVNLKCASCHDSFINDWTLADAYGLAGVYADEPLEMVHCDKPTGKTAQVRFMFPELGAIDQSAAKAERTKQLAAIVTGEQNGRWTRTIVNRLWARFMGRGLVEPVDEMDEPAWHPDLLDGLAEDLVASGYDLKRTMEQILTSQAYQLPAVQATEQAEPAYVFRGPVVRRLSAEQFLDALSELTGLWHETPAAQVDFNLGTRAAGPLDRAVRGQWIWSEAGASERAAASTIFLRREINLPELPTQAAAVVTCDNRFKLFINGKEAGSSGDHTSPKFINIRSHLVKGRNVLAVEATNDKAKPDDKDADQANPAGFLFYAQIRHVRKVRGLKLETVLDIGSDRAWTWSSEKAEGWTKAGFTGTGWKPATELGEPAMGPWNLGAKLETAVASTEVVGRVRAALVNNNPLMIALGRPNREQVTTTRASHATTLQALELTNGSTLADWMKRGAEELTQTGPRSGRELAARVFEQAVGRRPSSAELRTAGQLVGNPVRKEGVEDLLWAVSMLPEFQLIY